MGTISDFSTGAAFFRNLTDRVFVQLKRGQRASLPVIGERRNQFVRVTSCFDSEQRQKFWQILTNRDCTFRLRSRTEGPVKWKMKLTCRKRVLPRASDTGSPQQHTRPATSDHLKKGTTSSNTDTRQPLGPCRLLLQISCLCRSEIANKIPMSRSDVYSLGKDDCLQLMEQL